MKHLLRTSVLLAPLWLSACAETQFVAQAGKMWGNRDPQSVEQAAQINPNIPYKLGKPYQVDGKWYTPREDWNYVQEGMASWYGDEFHGRSTASGERFNKYELTAAHKTLPMPSLIRVTNLDNGRSAILRVNDRGPFSQGRILDVSHEAAKVLGFELQGTARVRVEMLSEESKRLANAHGANIDGVPKPVRVVPDPSNDDELTPISQAAASSIQNDTVGSEELSPLPTTQSPIATNNKPAFTPPPAPAIHPIATDQGFFVQVGAFADVQNVERLKTRLKTLGQVQVTPLESKGRTLYRVRLGPLQDMQQASGLKTKINDMGMNGAKIVME